MKCDTSINLFTKQGAPGSEGKKEFSSQNENEQGLSLLEEKYADMCFLLKSMFKISSTAISHSSLLRRVPTRYIIKVFMMKIVIGTSLPNRA